STSDMTARIGNYTITETNLPAGWALKNISCTNTISTNLASGQITARVVPGVTTVCTYTDTKYGHLIVTKVTIPATDTSTPFPITATGGASITRSAYRRVGEHGRSRDSHVTP